MKKSTVTAKFRSPIETIWNVVTDNAVFAWRSDIVKIEISDDGNSFTEFTKDGFETKFTITTKILHERYEFDIRNKNMNGHWTGIFAKDGSDTRIEFTEEMEVANPVLRLFIKPYLKKQQAKYLADLRKALGE